MSGSLLAVGFWEPTTGFGRRGPRSSWDASLIAQTGLTFDLSTPQGRLVASLMASLAEFEHELLRERVKSGIAAAKARGQKFGRPPGPRPSGRHAPEVLRLADEEKLSQRATAARLGISKTTVNEILKRRGETEPDDPGRSRQTRTRTL